MLELINEHLVIVLALVPVVTGVVEAIKSVGLPKSYSEVTSILVGIGLSVALLGVGNLSETIVAGIILGLAASGLWDGGKRLRGKKF